MSLSVMKLLIVAVFDSIIKLVHSAFVEVSPESVSAWSVTNECVMKLSTHIFAQMNMNFIVFQLQ